MSIEVSRSVRAKRGLTAYLSRCHDSIFAAYAITAAFSTYFCMYAFRKPFAAGTFEGVVGLPLLPPVDYKILLIIAQVCGYCLSKFMGIKVVSEMTPARRAVAILILIGIAEAALLGLAVAPRPWGVVFLFLNGLPLGVIWGTVFGFLEGRRLSELLGAGLSGSFIVASGFVKTVGRWLMQAGVPEVWMPFVTGLIFLPPMLIFVGMLSKLPPPSAEDEALRTRREPMSGAQRRKFFLLYAPGLVGLTFLYMFLTAFRDFRDNFAREIWAALGYDDTPSIMTTSEIPIAIAVLVVLAALMLIRDNRRALTVVQGIMLAGTLCIGASTAAFQAGLLGPVSWMICVGLGLYIAYVPYGCMLFDRLIATVGFVGTSGFMIYVTDAFGYLGSVFLLLYKNFGQPDLSWFNFFIGFAYATAGVCAISFIATTLYFRSAVRAPGLAPNGPDGASTRRDRMAA